MSSDHDTSSTPQSQYVPTSNSFMARYVGPLESEMTPLQLSIRKSIIDSRPHTGISGPFGPWLSVPNIAEPSQALGKTVRYETSLSFRESELVILLTGAKFKSETEFDIHVGEARRAGIGWDVIHAIPRGKISSNDKEEDNEFCYQAINKVVIPLLEKEHDERKPESYDTESQAKFEQLKRREVAIVTFAAELLDTFTVSDDTYTQTKAILDGRDSTLVEITAIIGYYAYVSFTLNAFKIPSIISPTE